MRRFEHDGVTWDVELTGTGGEGCGAHRLLVRFSSAVTGEQVDGEVVVAGAGRLTDEVLRAALDAARIEEKGDGILFSGK
jgi:hypothetical protein